MLSRSVQKGYKYRGGILAGGCGSRIQLGMVMLVSRLETTRGSVQKIPWVSEDVHNGWGFEVNGETERHDEKEIQGEATLRFRKALRQWTIDDRAQT